jgi:hypothetical protein
LCAVWESSKAIEESNPTFTVTGPSAPRPSDKEGNKPPSINNQQQNPNHSPSRSGKLPGRFLDIWNEVSHRAVGDWSCVFVPQGTLENADWTCARIGVVVFWCPLRDRRFDGGSSFISWLANIRLSLRDENARPPRLGCSVAQRNQ